MDWKSCAVDDLRKYNLLKIGILNSRDRIRAVESAAKRGRVSVENDALHTDSRLIDAIVESERLNMNIKTAEALIKLVDRGLSALDETEKKVLEKFYMSSSPVNIHELENYLGYQARTVYRVRDRALTKFTLAMYGFEAL